MSSFMMYMWHKMRTGPSLITYAILRNAKCRCDAIQVGRQVSFYLLLPLLLLPSWRWYCFQRTDTVWPLIFQIVNGVNGPISTTISMTMEFICWLFFFHIHTLCVSLHSVLFFSVFYHIQFEIFGRGKKCDSADLGLINNKMRRMWNYQI